MKKTNKKEETTSKKTLNELAEYWKQLERKTVEQRKEADTYYENILMEPIIQTFVDHNKGETEPVEYLVLSVGTSYEPLVLDIKLLKPQRILFLYTDKSEVYLDKVVTYCGLNAARYEKSMVHETEPLDIYREIKRAYLKWNKTEKLFYIDNPLEVFGDIEIEKALTLFGEYNYAGAGDRLGILKENIPEPNIRQELNFAYFLAKGYEAWDALDFPLAYENIGNLNREIRRDRRTHKHFLLMDFAEHLKQQEEVLSRLVKIPELVREKRQMDILSASEYMTPLMSIWPNLDIWEMKERNFSIRLCLIH